jgi:hypothetical protein
VNKETIMKMSIWQQYSSNHSGSVTIVGTFESPDAARAAAATLDGILTDLIAWHERPENKRNPLPVDAPPPPPEADLIRRYKLQVDRNFGFTEDVRASIRVQAVDRVVLLNIGETWNEPPPPLVQLVERLGGQEVSREFEIDGTYITTVDVHLTCVAPDESAAGAIYSPIHAYFQDPAGYAGEYYPWEGDDVTDARGSVQRDGARLIFDLRFYQLRAGLPAFVAFLTAKGCSQITYTLTEAYAQGTYWNWA